MNKMKTENSATSGEQYKTNLKLCIYHIKYICAVALKIKIIIGIIYLKIYDFE